MNIILNIENLDFKKGKGLMPVIVQDFKTREVLTLAYVNIEALKQTIDTGFTHFFRRTFKKVMKKGATSGNLQKIKEILVDCDHDSIIFLVEPFGSACHLNQSTCFHNKLFYEKKKK